MNGILHLIYDPASWGNCSTVLRSQDSVVLFDRGLMLVSQLMESEYLSESQPAPVYILEEQWQAFYGDTQSPAGWSLISQQILVDLTERYQLIQSWKA